MEVRILPAPPMTVEAFLDFDVSPLVDWISAIDLAAWPQQRPENGELRPAMVNDPEWFGFKRQTDRVVDGVLSHFPGCYAARRMLSVLMPGASIEQHTDHQPDNWVTRVHVPLTTDARSFIVVGGEVHRMVPGKMYLFNAAAQHSSVNPGTIPRIHFMFDVMR